MGLIQIRIQEASHNADKIAKFANKYWYKERKNSDIIYNAKKIPILQCTFLLHTHTHTHTTQSGSVQIRIHITLAIQNEWYPHGCECGSGLLLITT